MKNQLNPATPICNIIRERIERGYNADYWRNDLTGRSQAAYVRNFTEINSALADDLSACRTVQRQYAWKEVCA